MSISKNMPSHKLFLDFLNRLDQCETNACYGQEFAWFEQALLKLEAANELASEEAAQLQKLAENLLQEKKKDQEVKNAQADYDLSDREIECLSWSAMGKSSAEIGLILNLSERGINFHFNNATKKLNCVSRTQAVAKAISLNLIHPQKLKSHSYLWVKKKKKETK